MGVIHMGTDLPLADWMSAVARQRPDAVVIAVPMPSDVAPAVELVRGVVARQTLIAVGGQHQDVVVEAGSLGDPLAVCSRPLDQWRCRCAAGSAGICSDLAVSKVCPQSKCDGCLGRTPSQCLGEINQARDAGRVQGTIS